MTYAGTLPPLMGRLTNDIDGERSFPYLHFACWKRNEWSELHRTAAEHIKELSMHNSWAVDAAGFR